MRLQEGGYALRLQLSDTWTREIVVASNRTRPVMQTSGHGGYVALAKACCVGFPSNNIICQSFCMPSKLQVPFDRHLCVKGVCDQLRITRPQIPAPEATKAKALKFCVAISNSKACWPPTTATRPCDLVAMGARGLKDLWQVPCQEILPQRNALGRVFGLRQTHTYCFVEQVAEHSPDTNSQKYLNTEN